MAKIVVTYTAHYASGAVGGRQTKVLTDWFDFADWVKQTNLDGCSVCIHQWVYRAEEAEK